MGEFDDAVLAIGNAVLQHFPMALESALIGDITVLLREMQMRTTIALDDELVAKAQALPG
jgi:hypothetical protein